MAVSFKPLTQRDKTTSRTLLHESIPITGTLLAGTYAAASSGREINIKSFSHGMFQSVYDYPYQSSSANHIFDISAGFSTNAASVSSSATSQVSKKVNIYNQMAQVLVGFDTDSKIRRFDADGDFSGTGGTKHDDVIFLNFSRLLVKDEIKKGSFSMKVGTNTAYGSPFNSISTISDSDAVNSYKINSPAGEYGILKGAASAASFTITSTGSPNNGQAITLRPTDGSGPFVFTLTADGTDANGGGGSASNIHFARNGSSTHSLAELKALIEAHPTAKDKFTVGSVSGTSTKSLTITQKGTGAAGNTVVTNNLGTYSINGASAGSNGSLAGGVDAGSVGLIYYQAGVAVLNSSAFSSTAQIMNNATSSASDVLKKATIDNFADGIRRRVQNISFNNTTELNSTIYFCRANNAEFNYSSNPTYLTGSKIRVKTNPGTNEVFNLPRSYVTTVGLYSADNELLAVAKLSEPLRKDPTNELTLRVRLDF